MQIKTKFVILSIALFTMAVIAGALNYLGSEINTQQQTAMLVNQHHMDADMKHDGIRGNVYSALLASKSGDQQLLKDSQEAVAANLAADIPENVRDQFKKISGSVADYTSFSKNISQKAVDYDAALAMLPKLNERSE